MKNDNSDKYYYQSNHGEVHGPLPLETILVGVRSGRMEAGPVMLACDAAGPWLPLEDVTRMGAKAFGLSGKQRLQTVAKQAAARKPRKRQSVSGWFDVLALVQFVLAALAVGLLFNIGNWVVGFPWGVAAAVLAINGLWCMAIAEALHWLRMIAEREG